MQWRCRFQWSLVGGVQWCCWFQCLRVVAPDARYSSPCWSDGGREREKVRPARSKWPTFGVFTLAGRVFSRKCRWRGGAGRVFSRQPVLWPGLVGDAAHFRRLRWGFCAMRSPLTARRRRVGALDGVIPPDWWRSTRSLWWCRGQTADPLGEKSPKMALLAEWVCDLAESIAIVAHCSHVNPLLRVLTRYLECGRGCPRAY